MKNILHKLLRYILITSCLVTSLLSVGYILSQHRWSPIDEYAHMDYIEKLERGIFPKLSDTISQEIINHILQHPENCIGGPFQTTAQLGFTINSYQAKHPPFYYLLLVVPNKILKLRGTAIFDRLIILRLISYLLFLAGTCMVFPILKLLRHLSYKIPDLYAWLYVLFGLVICTHMRYGLGNNILSPLLINTSIYFLIKFYHSSSNKDLYAFICFTGLSLFTALTNILLVPFLFIFLIKKGFKTYSYRAVSISVAMLLGFSLLYFYWKSITIPNAVFEQIMYQFPAFNLPAGYFDFILAATLFLNDTFHLSFIKEGLDLSREYVILLALNLSLTLIFFKRTKKQHYWILIAYLMFFGFVFEFYFLNEYIGVVTWVAFRHYFAFIPLLFISCTGSLLLLNKKAESK